MKTLIFLLLLIHSVCFSQIICYKSAKYSFVEFTLDDNIKMQTIINDSAKFILCDSKYQTNEIIILIDFYEEEKIYTVFAIGSQLISEHIKSYKIRFISTGNIIHGINFDNKTGTIIFDEETIFINSGDFGILLIDYITEISIEK
jgi:hypothetical protein